jgi:transposase
MGLDLAKNVFQVHGVDGEGARLWSRRLRRDGLAAFFARQPRCVVEACAGAHHWGRVLAASTWKTFFAISSPINLGSVFKGYALG